jgi:hypothetical protein
MLGCKAQTNEKQKNIEKGQLKPMVVEKTVVVIDDCWKEFKDLTANISVKFCGEPRKDILNDTLDGRNIKRNSYLVLDTNANGNARYFLGWFDWKLKSENVNSLRNFYDEYSKNVLRNDPKGSIKETKEISFNGKIGRETTFAADDSNSLTIRLFYSNGKAIYLAFLPDELSSNQSLQNESKKRFFDSLQILEDK